MAHEIPRATQQSVNVGEVFEYVKEYARQETVGPLKGAGRWLGYGAAGAILLASENAMKVANEAIQALGGAGYTRDWPVERLLRDAKLYDIGAGTNEIRRFLIGRELVGG